MLSRRRVEQAAGNRVQTQCLGKWRRQTNEACEGAAAEGHISFRTFDVILRLPHPSHRYLVPALSISGRVPIDRHVIGTNPSRRLDV